MMSSSHQQLKQLEQAWKDVLDPHTKGIIDLDEFSASIHRAKPSVPQHAIQSLFKLLNSGNAHSVHGHIDENEFIQGITRNANKPAHMALFKQCLLASSPAAAAATSSPRMNNDEAQQWHRVFREHFGDLSCVNQNIWVDKMLALNLSGIDEDDLRLFHACLDSQFRSSFDVGEFVDTFTAPSLHHRRMDRVRELIKRHLLPSSASAAKTATITAAADMAVATENISGVNTRKKVGKEISVQTDMFDLREQIRSVLHQHPHIQKDEDAEDTKDGGGGASEYDQEIEALEEHIRMEEQFLRTMDTIDALKEENAAIFQWDNALLWNEYHCINFLMDIGLENVPYVNAFERKKVSGAMLLNGSLTADVMASEMGINEIDALLIEKSIFILKDIRSKVSKSGPGASKSQAAKHQNEMLTFYARKCEHLNRELVKLRKIEQMFKKKRRETESNLKQLERNMYFGSLSASHLVQKFDLDQLFQIQTAYHKTLANVQHAIQHKVNSKE